MFVWEIVRDNMKDSRMNINACNRVKDWYNKRTD